MPEKVTGEKFREMLIKEVQDAGRDLIDNAAGYVGDVGLLSEFEIVISFDPLCKIPTISINKGYLCQNTCERYRQGVDE